VVKIGSSLFCSEKEGLDLSWFNHITEQIIKLVDSGKEVIVVSSGAIALGMDLLKIESRPRQLPLLQAAAAVGQHELMDVYRKIFKQRQLNCGQVLLTWEDFSDRKRYLNAKNTLLTLLKLGIIPVINENDTVSTAEIKFGDNDRLSALVASLIGADLLIILSDVDGLLDKNKKAIKVVDEITAQIKELACPTQKKACVGGMITKIEAAKIAVDSGIPCVIANGTRQDVILSCLNEPASSGTLFVSKKGLAARERWLAFGTKPKGAIIIDEGAKKALLNKKSLLSVGVIAIEGEFSAGDIVSVRDKQGQEIARGKVGLNSKQLEEVKGKRYDREIIHRDNLVVV
jgi:glutamate 5-kinase